MKIKSLISSLTVSIAAVSIFALPTAAQAASCSNPSIMVATNVVSVEASHSINYSYSFCYNSQSNYYTVQVVKENPAAGGTFTDEGVAPTQTTPLSGAAGTTEGHGSFTPTTQGRYKVIVAYYEKGQATWESEGETLFLVTSPPAPVTPEVVKEEPVAAPEVAKAPATPQPPAVVTPEDPPAAPIGHTETPKAKIALVKHAIRSVVRAGRTAAFTLTVSNASQMTAENVVVCDALPAQTQYVGASKLATFKGASACFSVGNLKIGASAKITIRLSVNTGTHGSVVNHATATATNAPSVSAQAKVRVPGGPRKLVSAPVTG